MKSNWNQRHSQNSLMPYAIAGIIAVGLKYHYSHATADDLTWILTPTSHLVSWLTGLSFVMESAAGYINRDLGIIIAPSCSGVNFFIIAFAMAFFSFARKFSETGFKYLWIGAALTSSYALTLVVNTVRIWVSIATISHDLHSGWLTAERIHRIEGIVIYFFFFFLFYQGLNRMTAPCTKPIRGLNRIPLGWYLTMVLAVPIISGNFRHHPANFIEHTITVLILCVGLLTFFEGLRWLINAPSRPKDSFLNFHPSPFTFRNPGMECQALPMGKVDPEVRMAADCICRRSL